MKKIFTCLLFSCIAAGMNAQVRISGDTDIIVQESGTYTMTAAGLLQRFIGEITGDKPEIISGTKVRKGDILISDDDTLPEDAFRLTADDRHITIRGNAKGCIYGAVTLLDEWMDVDYWSENEYDIKTSSCVKIPQIDTTVVPGFAYRQAQNYATKKDTVYRWWYRLETPEEAFAGGYWVHTFDRLLPASVYGKEHPEYYAYYNGMRHPGKASQWCLTNPEVLEIVCARIDSIFAANPGQDLICISQNDGNDTYCRCPECRRIDSIAGSPSGSMIYFLNKVAKRYPDKDFATLAYLYTMKPPKDIIPEPNVVVMLCDIDCTRELPLAETEKGKEFVTALEGWSSITEKLFVWDYGINFDNFISPFPNFHIIDENIRLFRDNKATMHFSQINCPKGCDFAEMRTYLSSELMWNPDADCDELIKEFLNGYYGPAAPHIFQYINIMEGALLSSGIRLWIYDSPVTHKNGMLKPSLMRRYNELFDKAERAVAEDSVRLARVQRSRMSLIYAELEIARTEENKDIARIDSLLGIFESRSILFEIPMLNERYNTPVQYCKQYRQRYMPGNEPALSLGAGIQYIIPPAKDYAKLGETALTDGLFGGSTFVESWVGWVGKDADFVVDLGEVKSITSVSTDFLHQIGAWILMPLSVTYSYSVDGTDYSHWETIEMPEDRDIEVKFREVTAKASDGPINARYIRVQVTGTKICPHWHYGVGHKSWLFIDEVTVR